MTRQEFELFDSTLPWVPDFQVYGIGEVGKQVIHACELHHLAGIKYEVLDEKKSDVVSRSSWNEKSDLCFIVVSVQDLDGLQLASLISSSISQGEGKIITVLSGYSASDDRYDTTAQAFSNMRRHSMTVIDVYGASRVEPSHESMLNNQYRAIAMLTQPFVEYCGLGLDMADLELLLSKSPYMRCANVCVDGDEKEILRLMLEQIYNAEEEYLHSSLVSLSGKGMLDKVALMSEFGDEISQASVPGSMHLSSQVACADEKSSTHLSLLVAVESKSVAQVLCHRSK